MGTLQMSFSPLFNVRYAKEAIDISLFFDVYSTQPCIFKLRGVPIETSFGLKESRVRLGLCIGYYLKSNL